MNKLFSPIVLLSLLITCGASAQNIVQLQQKIQQLISAKSTTVGISIIGNNENDTLSINGDEHFPLQSVFKFHIALAVLHEVDEDKLLLYQKVPVKISDLLPDTWSPLREKYPNGNIKISLAEVLKYTVSQSDNNGCDILLRLIGGTKKSK
ncbi:MAG: serine hydrolase [Ginsengibacter sp.]